MNLFQHGSFTLASGKTSSWKLECDALTAADWEGVAHMLSLILPPFGAVEGVPRGGLQLAEALKKYTTNGPLLLADDVWTTGATMKKQRRYREVLGTVLFARGWRPAWVYPLLTINSSLWPLEGPKP